MHNEDKMEKKCNFLIERQVKPDAFSQNGISLYIW